jgi:Flp pilus assembly protein TadG
MRIRQIFRRGVIREFAHSESANIALVFSLALLPIIAFVGASIDYSRANAIRSALQSALDSTALMLAKEASGDSATALNANAAKYFNANFTPHITVSNIQVGATYSTSGGSKVVVNGSVDVPTTFLGVVGFRKLTLGGSSTSSWGNARLRVALALDNTGSMAEAGKMTALQSATHNLLDQLKAAASQNGDVYVSIIPFSKDVNVGTSYKDQNWIDWSLITGTSTSSGTCTSGTTNVFANFIASLINNANSCRAANFIWTAGTSTSVSNVVKSTWNGCITDRLNVKIPDNSTEYDRSAYAPDPSLPNSLFPAEQYTSCPAQMMGLSYDWVSLNALVDSMKPAGNTNQPIGLVWAWQSLVGGGPLSVPPMNSTDVYQTYIILLSDGLNTEDRFSTNQSDVDSRMYDPTTGAGTCANIKGAGITIYTIQVNTGGDPTSTLLKNCASKPTYFYEIKQAGQIADVFKDIGTGMTRLRLAL